MHSPSQPLSLRRNTKGIVFGLPSRASAGLAAVCKSQGAPCVGVVGRGSCSFFLLGGVRCGSFSCLWFCFGLRRVLWLSVAFLLFGAVLVGAACLAWVALRACAVSSGVGCVGRASGWSAVVGVFALSVVAAGVGGCRGLCAGSFAVAVGRWRLRLLLLLCPLALVGGFFFVRAKRKRRAITKPRAKRKPKTNPKQKKAPEAESKPEAEKDRQAKKIAARPKIQSV